MLPQERYETAKMVRVREAMHAYPSPIALGKVSMDIRLVRRSLTQIRLRPIMKEGLIGEGARERVP